MPRRDQLDELLREALHEEAMEIPIPDVNQAYERLCMQQQKERIQRIRRIVLRSAAAILVAVIGIGLMSRPGYALFGWTQKLRVFDDFAQVISSSVGRGQPKLALQSAKPPDIPAIIAQLPYKPGFPSLLPSGFRLLEASVNVVANPMVQLRLHYGEPSVGELILTEVNLFTNGGAGDTFPGSQAKNVRIGANDGVMLTQEDGKHRLVFANGNIMYTMVSDLPQEMLLAVAKSIQQ